MLTRGVLTWACLLALAAAAPAQDAQDDGLKAFWDAYRAREWKKAIALCEGFLAADPSSATMTYNMACLHSLDGRPEEAVRWLVQAASLGFGDAGLVETDADLSAARAHKDYPLALEKIRANGDAALADYRRRVEDAKLLILPPEKLDPERPAPVIIALHPYGGSADSFAEVWKAVAHERGAILVVPQSALAVGDLGVTFQWGSDAQADLVLRRALARVREAHKVDDKRIVLTGFSQGGQMTFTLGMRHADQFCGLIPVGGLYQPQAAPPREKKDHLPRVFIMAGANEDAQLLESNREAEAAYRAAGIAVELKLFPNTGHAFPPERDAELRKALDFVMK